MQQKPQLVSEGLGGYISMEVPAPPEEFGYGVSLYATAWPLVEKPLRDFQIGLASIWIVPENRFIDQPSLQDADLSESEKKEYLPPPSMGTLATLDPALLVKPPRGLERGYVPIVVHQQQRKEG